MRRTGESEKKKKTTKRREQDDARKQYSDLRRCAVRNHVYPEEGLR